MSEVREISHYASIAAVLLAGDIQARVVSNGTTPSVVVTAEGDRVIWGNDGEVWAFTVVTASGMTIGGLTETPYDVPPEDVATMIAAGVPS